MERNILEAPLRVLNNYVVIANSWGWIVCVQGHGLAEDADGGGGEEGGGGGEHDAGQGLRAEQGRAEAGAVVRRPAPAAVDGERAGGVAGPPVRAQRQVQRRDGGGARRRARRGRAVPGVGARPRRGHRGGAGRGERGGVEPLRVPRRRVVSAAVGAVARAAFDVGAMTKEKVERAEEEEHGAGAAGDVAHARVQVDAPASPAHAAREQPDGHYKNKMM